jgi:hypothetical protein
VPSPCGLAQYCAGQHCAPKTSPTGYLQGATTARLGPWRLLVPGPFLTMCPPFPFQQPYPKPPLPLLYHHAFPPSAPALSNAIGLSQYVTNSDTYRTELDTVSVPCSVLQQWSRLAEHAFIGPISAPSPITATSQALGLVYSTAV